MMRLQLVFYLLVFINTMVFCPSGFAAERLAVAVPIANIRTGPGTNYDILWNAEKFFPILILEKKGGWYRFRDFEGDVGWVHKSLIQKIPSVITVKPKCNIRAGPGMSYEILFSVESGVPFKILKTQGNWIYVEHADGDRGWIHKGLVW